MSSSSQATDLSMDEILASIRKIISEDPRATAPSPPPARPSVPAAGTFALPQPNSKPTVPMAGASVSASHEPLAAAEARAPRPRRPALDDDILDLMEEDRPSARIDRGDDRNHAQGKARDDRHAMSEPAAAAPAAFSAAPFGAVAAPPSTVSTPMAIARSPELRGAPAALPPRNEMWTPREWSRPGNAAPVRPSTQPDAQVLPTPPTAPLPAVVWDVEPAAQAGDAPEARLEAAIAALGQSLATQPTGAAPTQRPFEAPAKFIAGATAQKSPPTGPRIDVVAVVNAATRAALGQRTADEQVALPAYASPPAHAPADEAAAEGTVAQTPASEAVWGPSASRTDHAPASVRTTQSIPGASSSASSNAPQQSAPVQSAAVLSAIDAAIARSSAKPVYVAPPLPSALAVPMPTETAMPPVAISPAATVAEPPVPPPQAPEPEPEAVVVAAPIPPPSMPSIMDEIRAVTSVRGAASAPAATAGWTAETAPTTAVSERSIGPGPTWPAPAVEPAVASEGPSPAPHATQPLDHARVQTLEDTVSKLLRPMLRQWLDDHMPRIVEKAFKEELAAQTPAQKPARPN